MTDQELFAYDRSGFIPGPEEEESVFLNRIQGLKKRFDEGTWIPSSHWEWVREMLFNIFHVKPLYICAFYSNRSLSFWEAAAAWIEAGKLQAVQLCEGLRKGRYLGLYRREEILAHEAIHAVRAAFNEDRFEEFFAYMTSEKKWRRVLGPILRRPWEAWVFVLLALGGVMAPLFSLGALIWVVLGFTRLIRGHFLLRKAGMQIQAVVGDSGKTRAILLRLTDKEIVCFAKGINIQEYAKTKQCLRWRVLKNYLGESYGKENCCA